MDTCKLANHKMQQQLLHAAVGKMQIMEHGKPAYKYANMLMNAHENMKIVWYQN